MMKPELKYSPEQKLHKFLKGLVEIDSFTENKEGVDAAQRYTEEYINNSTAFTNAGFKLWKVLESEVRGNLHIYRNKSSAVAPGSRSIILSGHIDTVYRELYSGLNKNGDKWFGPGVNDMKGGVAVMILGLEEYFAAKSDSELDIWMFVMPDEEEASNAHKQALLDSYYTDEFELGLVFEGGGINHEICIERKGVWWLNLTSKGKASHAGYVSSYEDNAIMKAALFLNDLNNIALPENTTFNPGVIVGGEKPNIIPDKCTILVDSRFSDFTSMNKLKELISGLAKKHGLEMGTKIDMVPLEKNPKQQPFLEKLHRAAAELGIKLVEESRGGASDGGPISGLGVPVIDGLGAPGAGAHSGEEYILVEATIARMNLFAKFLSLL